MTKSEEQGTSGNQQTILLCAASILRTLVLTLQQFISSYGAWEEKIATKAKCSTHNSVLPRIFLRSSGGGGAGIRARRWEK